MNDIIKQWANSRFINESFQENPDADKTDDMDMKGDDYEKELEMKKRHEEEQIKNKELNSLKENETKNNTEKAPADEDNVESDKEKVDEVMNADEILKKYNDKKKEGAENKDAKSTDDKNITSITINDIDDGYVNATVERGTDKKTVELEIPEKEIDDMLEKLLKNQHNGDKIPSEEDACAALIYLMTQKNVKEADAIKWVFGKNGKRGLNDWEFLDNLDVKFIEGVDDRGFSSVWNTGKSNSEYNELDMDSHDEDDFFNK